MICELLSCHRDHAM